MERKIAKYNSSEGGFSYNHSITDFPETPPVHVHNHYEIYYFLSGDVTYYIENQAYNIKNNDLLIINNKELHKPVFKSRDTYERIIIHFDRDFVLPYQSNQYNLLYYFEKRELGQHNRIKASDCLKYGIKEYYEKIEQYILNSTAEQHVMISSLFVQLLVKLNSIYLEQKNIKLDSFKYDDKILSILNFINNNIASEITLDMLEEKFYINKYYLCHLFKKNTGFTIMEYISYKRILMAKDLILKGLPVMELHQTVGFNDYSNFYKAFKKLVGTSPRKFARQIESF